MRKLIFLLFGIIIFSCQTDFRLNNKYEKEVLLTEISIKYAQGFTIEQYENYKIITLSDTWKRNHKTHKYVLYSDQKPKEISDAIFIKTPIKSIACMSLTHVAFIEKLGCQNSIIALSGCDYVSSNIINNRISNNLIKEIGQAQNLNYEMLVDQNPAIVLAFGINETSDSYLNKLQTLGLDVVLNAEYMEVHPLGKAEWIKFVAAFYDENEKAEAIFDSIEKMYLNLLAITNNITKKPTVFAGMPWKGAWYVPGAKSFQANLFKDAGAQYLWANDNQEKSSLVKSKEIIIDQAIEGDYWLNLNNYDNITAVVAFDEKFKGFKAVKKQQLFNNDNRINSKMGNDYWESGVVNPHLILKDLIKIFHPQLINHELYYYRRLNQ